MNEHILSELEGLIEQEAENFTDDFTQIEKLDAFRLIICAGLAALLAERQVGAVMAEKTLGCLKNLPTNVKCTLKVYTAHLKFD